MLASFARGEAKPRSLLSATVQYSGSGTGTGTGTGTALRVNCWLVQNYQEFLFVVGESLRRRRNRPPKSLFGSVPPRPVELVSITWGVFSVEGVQLLQAKREGLWASDWRRWSGGTKEVQSVHYPELGLFLLYTYFYILCRCGLRCPPLRFSISVSIFVFVVLQFLQITVIT